LNVPDKGAAEVNRRLTLKYASEEASKIVAKGERTQKTQEKTHPEHEEIQEVTTTRGTILLEIGRKEAFYKEGMEAPVIGIISKIDNSNGKVTMRCGENELTVSCADGYFAEPLDRQPTRQQERQKRKTERDQNQDYDYGR
jgi:hypothetical protein